MTTNTDLEVEYWRSLGHTGTLADMRQQEYAAGNADSAFEYWAAGSGLLPASEYSLTDHQLAVFRGAIPDPSLSYTDSKRAYFSL